MPEWKTPEMFITAKDPNILKQITRIPKGNCPNILLEKETRDKSKSILKMQNSTRVWDFLFASLVISRSYVSSAPAVSMSIP
jgi:hypothetical protein